jgi:glycosyltransferase involved in cell wall biosynthesis
MYVIDRLYNHGGGEEALLRIVQKLPRDKFRISVVTFDANPAAAQTVRTSGADLHVFPMRRAYDWNGLKTALKLRRLIRAGHVDIVHTFFETSNTWGGLIAKLSGRSLLISGRRDMGILRLKKHHIAYKLINRISDGFVAVSESVRNYSINTEGLDPSRVFTVHNGVDLARIDSTNGEAALRARLALPEGCSVVATVANIRKIKGLDTLLQAAAIVRREFPCVRFLVAGGCLEQRHFAELQNQVRTFGLDDNVRFLGRFEEVFSLLKLSNVFCLLSRSEGFSNALLEAMASGLPCVATRVGGNPEAIEDGQNGFLVPAEDPNTAAQRIAQLLRNPEQARRVGRAARQTVEESFTVDKMSSQLARLYQCLLSNGQVSPDLGNDVLGSSRHASQLR